MNSYTCELCGARTKDYDVVRTPFYFTVLDGPDDDAWGKHSNEAKVCDTHVADYEWPVFAQYSPNPHDRSDRWSPRQQLEADVTGRIEAQGRRLPDGATPDYYFARHGEAV